ncbi:hypothetical protein BKA64DRAFT_239321 [Cadophora sp. MPI-SDFR-AT-0126]|nr:hypothetical protein BKA64DRAFT_239321 [Leotiomycetes sp. MPI-SDFR-AT-0126]
MHLSPSLTRHLQDPSPPLFPIPSSKSSGGHMHIVSSAHTSRASSLFASSIPSCSCVCMCISIASSLHIHLFSTCKLKTLFLHECFWKFIVTLCTGTDGPHPPKSARNPTPRFVPIYLPTYLAGPKVQPQGTGSRYSRDDDQDRVDGKVKVKVKSQGGIRWISPHSTCSRFMKCHVYIPPSLPLYLLAFHESSRLSSPLARVFRASSTSLLDSSAHPLLDEVHPSRRKSEIIDCALSTRISSGLISSGSHPRYPEVSPLPSLLYTLLPASHLLTSTLL